MRSLVDCYLFVGAAGRFWHHHGILLCTKEELRDTVARAHGGLVLRLPQELRNLQLRCTFLALFQQFALGSASPNQAVRTPDHVSALSGAESREFGCSGEGWGLQRHQPPRREVQRAPGEPLPGASRSGLEVSRLQAPLASVSSRHGSRSPDSQARGEAAVASGGGGTTRLIESHLSRRYEAAYEAARQAAERQAEQMAQDVEEAETPEQLLALFENVSGEDLEDRAMRASVMSHVVEEDGTTVSQSLRQLVQERAAHPEQPQGAQQPGGAAEAAAMAAGSAPSPPEVAQRREASQDTVFLRIKEKEFLDKDDARSGLTIAVRLSPPQPFAAGWFRLLRAHLKRMAAPPFECACSATCSAGRQIYMGPVRLLHPNVSLLFSTRVARSQVPSQ